MGGGRTRRGVNERKWPPQGSFDNDEGFRFHQLERFCSSYVCEINDSLQRACRCGSTILNQDQKSGEDNRKSMNKKLSVRDVFGTLEILAITIVALGMSAPSLHAQAPAAGPPPPAPAPLMADMKGKTADQFYKKIEVLKGVPAEEVHPAMKYITTALGVGCGYCHVIGHFDQEDKREKHVARSMMAMTMAVDSTVFEGKRELTCYTCHRGAAKADSTLLLTG